MTIFKSPNLREEIGEIERVAQEYADGFEKGFTEEFLKRGAKSSLSTLESGVWSRLENTDSFDIRKDDWKQVEGLAGQVGRNWEDLKEKMIKGHSVDAPIIIKIEGKYHLVSGNTRLMVAKALGISPKVLVVDMTNFENPELVKKREELKALNTALENEKEKLKEIEEQIKTLTREVDKLES